MARIRAAIIVPLVLGALAFIAVACVAPSLPTSNTGADAESSEIGATVDGSAGLDASGFLPAEDPPRKLLRSHWETDFSRRMVEWDEILSGGPAKDGIPAIDAPTYQSVADASEWLSDQDPVIVYEHNNAARAYPLAILIWHEIVNDEVGGRPVTLTFCPLCNASIVFDRSFDGQVLDFGTTGLLRNSDLVMYDRQTETWWQQFTGQGIVGEYAGEQLEFLPSQVVSFADFRKRYPDSDVLARPSQPRSYGSNPYVGYDSTQGRPFLYSGELDTRLAATERVVGVDLGDRVKAYPFAVIAESGPVNDELSGTPLVVFHQDGTASALDSGAIAEGRDVGSAAAYDRRVGDQTLTFKSMEDGTIQDVETGSTWNIFGSAMDGELAGTQLEQILSFDHFWFAWAAFHPETELYTH